MDATSQKIRVTVSRLEVLTQIASGNQQNVGTFGSNQYNRMAARKVKNDKGGLVNLTRRGENVIARVITMQRSIPVWQGSIEPAELPRRTRTKATVR
jgi:hypothetical protein